MAVSEDLRQKREDLVKEHMELENRHEYEATIDTFDHPRYELIGTGDVYDGPEEVARYFEEARTAFPDQRNELITLHHADDSVVVEANLHGTHLGPFRGLPPTGRRFEMHSALDAGRYESRHLLQEARQAPILQHAAARLLLGAVCGDVL